MGFTANASDLKWNHYVDSPTDRLMLRIETLRPYQEDDMDQSQALGMTSRNKAVCKISIWSGATRHYLLDVVEYAKHWNHNKVTQPILGCKVVVNGLLIKALSPLSQLSHTILSTSGKEHTYSRVQVRTSTETDAQKVLETLKEFCPGLDGGKYQKQQKVLSQQASGRAGRDEGGVKTGLLTESQMGGMLVDRSHFGQQESAPMTPSIDSQGFRKPPPPSQPRTQPVSYLAFTNPRYPDLENDSSYYPDRQPLYQNQTPFKAREREIITPRKGLFVRHPSSQSQFGNHGQQTQAQAQGSSSRPVTPAMSLSLRGGPEHRNHDFRFDTNQHPAPLLARGTINSQADLFSSPQKRSYEELEAEAQQESYTQPETSAPTPSQWPTHSASSPRAQRAQLYPQESPSAKRSKRNQHDSDGMDMSMMQVHDRPLIDLDAPTIRMARRTPLIEPEQETAFNPASLPSNQIGNTATTPFDQEAIITEVRNKSALYSLEKEDLEDVIASVICEDGFAEFVKKMQGLWQARIKIGVEASR